MEGLDDLRQQRPNSDSRLSRLSFFRHRARARDLSPPLTARRNHRARRRSSQLCLLIRSLEAEPLLAQPEHAVAGACPDGDTNDPRVRGGYPVVCSHWGIPPPISS